MTDVTETTQAPAAGGATERAPAPQRSPRTKRPRSRRRPRPRRRPSRSEAAAEAKDVLTDVRQQLRSQAEEQSAKVAALVGDIGTQLRKMAAAGESGPAKDIVAGVADQAQQMSQRLGDGGLDRTLSDARRLARNRPGLFLAGAALAGFVAARVVRAADTDGLKQAATGSNGSSRRRRRRPGSRPDPRPRSPPGVDGARDSRPADRGAVMSATVEPGPAPDPTQPVEPDQSLGELVNRMTTDVGQLVSTQIELAKVEIKDEVARAGKGAGMVGGEGWRRSSPCCCCPSPSPTGWPTPSTTSGSGFFVVGLVYAAVAAFSC